MPGFNINGTGALDGGPANTLETRRKHRWIFKTLGKGQTQFESKVLLVLKTATRPHPTFEEPVMHHNQEQAYFAGKHSWEACTMSWYDIEQGPDVSKEMFDWLNKVCDISTVKVSVPSQYKSYGQLEMLKGDGKPSESWRMYGCWPQDINWGDLDYENTEINLIEIIMRFDRAYRETPSSE